MIDIAQLREALAEIGADYNDTADPIVNAARELLTIKEAGALIITPDEETVRRIAEVLFDDRAGVFGAWHVAVNSDRVFFKSKARAFLDALRDAMPDGET